MFVLVLYANKNTDEILFVFRSIAYLSDISDGTGSFYFMDSQHKIQVSVTCVYHYLYRVQSFIMLYFGSIGMDYVISTLCYNKGTTSQNSYNRKTFS